MSSQFEREIDELLRRLDGEDPGTGNGTPPHRHAGQGWTTRLKRVLTRRWGFLTTEQLVAAVVALVLFSYIARFALPAVGRYLAMALLTGLVALVVYAISQGFRQGR